MIYFLLTIFFVSLLSILFMIGRKIRLVKSGIIPMVENASFEIPYLEEGKYVAIENIKKYEHKTLVFVIRSYFQTTNFLKSEYKDFKKKVRKISVKHSYADESGEKSEFSKVVKAVSNYVHKIREIKHKIKEEEKN